MSVPRHFRIVSEWQIADFPFPLQPCFVGYLAISDVPPSQLNPYAPPESLDGLGEVLVDPSRSEPIATRNWWQSLGVWSIVCVVSAAPSFFWGLSTVAHEQALAMIVGVAIFIALYTIGDQKTKHSAWRRNSSLRLTLKIAYITRIAISIILPVGGMLDLFCGLFSVSIVEFLLNNKMSLNVGPEGEALRGGAGFFAALFTTLVQGLVLNVVLMGYALVVWGVVALVKRGR